MPDSFAPAPPTPSVLLDPARVTALRRTGLLDSPPEANFDRFTSLVARLLHVPISLISLVSEDRQFFKSQHGLPEPWASVRQTGLSHSLCQHVVASREPLIVPDVRAHELLSKSLAARDLNVAAYLGVPLRMHDSQILGSLCAIDTAPHRWSDDDLHLLTEMAGLVITEIELRLHLSERGQIEHELRHANERLELAQQATGIGVFDYDPVEDLAYVSPRWNEIYGLAPGAPLPSREGWLELVHPADRARVREKADQTRESGETYYDEYRVLPPDGKIRFVQTSSKRMFDANGRHVRSIGTALDVTKLREADLQLQLTQERLLITHRVTGIGTWEHDLRTGLRWWSDETFQILGIPRCDPAPSHLEFLAMVHPEDRERVRCSAESISAAQPNADIDFRIVRPNGEVRWVTLLGRAIIDNGEVVRLIGANLDVTHRKQIEGELRASEERTRILLESLPQMMWLLRPNGSVEFFNHNWYEYTGLSAAAMDSLSWSEVIHPDDVPVLLARRVEAISTAQPYELEVRIRRASDGEYRWHAARVVPMWREGELYAWQGSAIDIHDRRVAEEALLRTEKLAAVGRLASSIAHEINNPLEAVTNLLYLIEQSPNLQEENLQYLRQAQQELARVSHIAVETLRFHRQSTRSAPVHAAELIDSVITLHQGRILNAGLRVERRFREAQPLMGDTAGIRQVLANLVGNAIDACPRGGRLILAKREATHPKTGEKGVRITVADSGEGMNPVTQARLFEPFYSTKPSTGTGLGLWVSKGIVDKHGGRLAFRSRSGAGTVFVLFLPYAQRSAEE